MASSISIKIPTADSCKVLSVKAPSARMISEGSVIARIKKDLNKEVINITAPVAGQIQKVCATVDDDVRDFAEIVILAPCEHSVVIRDLCAECGADLQGTKSVSSASISIVHHVPELRVTVTEADNIGKEDRSRLLQSRKLVLLVDLDHTLVHTTEVDVDPNQPGVHHYQLWGHEWYHTKIRPHAEKFLTKVHELFELHVFTFGARLYAHTVTRLLDPETKFFEHRIVSRDELFNSATKMGNVKALFPCGDEMVCIIDDRIDVWDHAMNLIHVKPYIFFKESGFIDRKKDSQSRDSEAPLSSEETTLVNGTEEKVKENPEFAQTDEVRSVLEKNISTIEANQTQSEKDAAEIVKDMELSCKKGDVQKGDNVPESNDEGEEEEEEEEEEEDDYLLHLEDILQRIHKNYFELYDRQHNDTGSVPDSSIPDLKKIIPQVKSKVLAGSVIAFTGVIPRNADKDTQLKHPAYVAARSLGARITSSLSKYRTTHLVSASLDTDKVKQARAMGTVIKIVSLDWLWCCFERWEWVDERLFPLIEEHLNKLIKKGVWRGSHKTYSEHEHPSEYADLTMSTEAGEDILDADVDATYSDDLEEIPDTAAVLDEQMKEEMMDELAEYLDGESDESDNEGERQHNAEAAKYENNDTGSSSEESLSGSSHPKGWIDVKRRRNAEGESAYGDVNKHSGLKKLCRPSDLSLDYDGDSGSDNDSYEESIGSVDEEMADALEKELADRNI